MKKAILLLSFLSLTIGTINSCSSSENDIIIAPSQDFSNADFIKNAMIGDWTRTASKTSSSASWNSDTNLPGTTPYISTYKFNSDNSYIYKPYTATNNSSLNENGTFTITPVINGADAYLTFTYNYNNTVKTRVIYLQDYNNGIVKIYQNTPTSPSGIYYERFVKQ